jgi:hypothetical protein
MPTTEAAILERILVPGEGELTPELARYILHLVVSQADRQRYEALQARERTRTLTSSEQSEFEAYRHVLLMIARIQEKARTILASETGSSRDTAQPPRSHFEIPPGIRRSQEALRRDLPQLLENRKLFRQWVAYHGDERIGIARDKLTLLRECLRRGLADDQYYIGWIHPTELIEEEELDPPPPGEIEEDEDAPTA